MFTGIVQGLGHVKRAERRGGDLRLEVYSEDLDWADVTLGDSIATNGVCLTAVAFAEKSYVADVSVETLSHTTLAHWHMGHRVNLELALTPKSRLGGHFVSGHVDGVGEILERHADARSERMRLRAPAELSRYIAHKGSITVDGVSLTVNCVAGAEFELNIVPHTMASTIMSDYRVGTKVNLEVDLLARYIERLLSSSAGDSADSALTESFLAEHGYMRR